MLKATKSAPVRYLTRGLCVVAVACFVWLACADVAGTQLRVWSGLRPPRPPPAEPIVVSSEEIFRLKMDGVPTKGVWCDTDDDVCNDVSQFPMSADARMLAYHEREWAASVPCRDAGAFDNPPMYLGLRDECAVLKSKARNEEMKRAAWEYMGGKERARVQTCVLRPFAEDAIAAAGSAGIREITLADALALDGLGRYIEGGIGAQSDRTRQVHHVLDELTRDGKVQNEAELKLGCVSEIKPVDGPTSLFISSADRRDRCSILGEQEMVFYCRPIEPHNEWSASFAAALEDGRQFPAHVRAWPRPQSNTFLPKWMYVAVLPRSFVWKCAHPKCYANERVWFMSDKWEMPVELLPAARETAESVLTVRDCRMCLEPVMAVHEVFPKIPPVITSPADGKPTFDGEEDIVVQHVPVLLLPRTYFEGHFYHYHAEVLTKMYYIADVLVKHDNIYLPANYLVAPHARTSLEAVLRYRFDEPWGAEADAAIASVFSRILEWKAAATVADVVLDVSFAPYNMKNWQPLEAMRTIASSLAAYYAHTTDKHVEVPPPLAKLLTGYENSPGGPIRILVSQHGGGRDIANADELIARLQPIVAAGPPGGWVKLFTPGQWPMDEQVAMWMSANLAIGFQGSQLTGALSMRPGGVVIELTYRPGDTFIFNVAASVPLEHWTVAAHCEWNWRTGIPEDYTLTPDVLHKVETIVRGYV